MGFMRRVRLSRSDADGNTAAEAVGLDAFGTEETLAAPASEEPKVVPQQAWIAIAVLGALVLIEAVPTALWIRARLRPPRRSGIRQGTRGAAPRELRAADFRHRKGRQPHGLGDRAAP